MKTCRTCLAEKALTEYAVARQNRDGLRTVCRACTAVARADHYAKNKAHELALNAAYREAHRESILARKREQTRAWVAANQERKRAADRAYERRMREERNASFLAQCAAKTKKYLAAKAGAMPQWADHAAILKFYELAAQMTELTGVPHQVDHVVPLQGELVCGLHTHHNLQILTAKANQSKSNKFEPQVTGY